MADSALERARQAMEEADTLEVVIEDTLHDMPSALGSRIAAEALVRACLETSKTRCAAAMEMIQPQNSNLRAELDSVLADESLKQFYARLDALPAATQPVAAGEGGDDTAPAGAIGPPPTKQTLAEKLAPKARFSTAEMHGKYMDLTPLHSRFLNLKVAGKARPSYLEYLRLVRTVPHKDLPDTRCRDKAYRKYVQQLATYACSFFRRSKPLIDLPGALMSARIAADELFAAGAAAGATAENGQQRQQQAQEAEKAAGVDLSAYSSATALEALGLDALKAELVRRGMKCGGNLAGRAKRLFSVKGLQPDQYPKKVLAKKPAAAAAAPDEDAAPPAGSKRGRQALEAAPQAPAAASTAASTPSVAEDPLTAIPFASDLLARGASAVELCAWHERVAERVLEHLRDSLGATRQHVEKQQTLTYEELVVDREMEERALLGLDEEGEGGDSSDDEDGATASSKYRGRRLVLGWDGKPISHWLYKLHGLNKEFPCDICGGQVYCGQRNFERHFSQPKHTDGMRALGIPNTRHFFGMTKIEEVRDLWAQLQYEVGQGAFDPSKQEEFEDDDGNVLDSRTYEDMARQGLLGGRR